MSDLPPGWAEATIGDLLLGIEAGKSFRCESRPATLDEWGVIKVSAMTWGSFREGENKAVPVGKHIEPSHEIKRGDILVSRANTVEYVGAPVLVENCRPHLLLSDKSLRIVPAKSMNPRWLYYLLTSPFVRREISKRATGTKDSMRNISQAALTSIRVKVPPLPEQRRIVATLEDHLLRLQSAERTIFQALRRVRILSRAVVDSILDDLENVPMMRLESLLREPLRNGHSARAISGTDNGIRTLTLTAVTQGQFIDTFTKVTTADPSHVRNLWLQPGDILIQRSNTTELVGKSALYTGPTDWAIFPDLLIRVRVNNSITPEYAQLILSTTQLRKYFKSAAKGLAGSMPKIDQPTILKATLPVPPIGQQGKIVDRARSQRSTVDHLQTQLEVAHRRSISLRRSLLAEALSGRLEPQDPSDESALLLLQRIRKERASLRETRHSHSALDARSRREGLL